MCLRVAPLPVLQAGWWNTSRASKFLLVNRQVFSGFSGMTRDTAYIAVHLLHQSDCFQRLSHKHCVLFVPVRAASRETHPSSVHFDYILFSTCALQHGMLILAALSGFTIY